MSLYPTGVVYSRASQEHGKRAVAAALHPRGKSVFLVSGQVIDEIDTSDGSLIYRIISDLSAPIVRLEVCTGARGYEYLLLLSAANELRVWDIERRFHFSSIKLGGGGGLQGDGGGSANPPAGPGISLLAPSQFHDRCILFYARAGSWQVEALHLQRQLEIPGSPALLTVVEPKSFSGKSPVSALAVHPHLPLLASATVEGVVSVHWCPFLGAPLEGGNNSSSNNNNATLLFAATLNPEVSLGQGGRVKRPPSSASIGSVGAAAMGHLDLADAVLTLAWHPYLPLLLAVDACGRVCVWSVGDFGGATATQPAAHHSLLASRAYAIPSTTPDEFPRIATSAAFHATLPYVWIASHAPSTPSLPPHIAAWSYAHATLPALPSPVSPSLAALMIAAAGDAVTAASAHLWMPPALLCVGGGRAGVSIWVGGRVIVSAFVAGCVGGVGVREDDESFGPLGRALMGGAVEEAGGNAAGAAAPARPRASNAYTAQALWPTEPSPGTTAPTVPYGAGGIVAGGAVGEVIHAPRRWFIAGGEGEGWDLSGAAASSAVEENSSSSRSKEEEEREEEELEEERRKKDLFGGGLSLADFAKSLAEGGDEGASGAAANTAATPQGTTTTAAKCIPAQRASAAGVYYATPPAQGEHCDALVYVDSVWEVPTAPNPRWTVAHYLAVRQLGFPAAAGDVGADGDSSSTTNTNTPSARRIAALPSIGPGGPIYPTSVRRSPNSRFYAVFFAYASAMSGEFLEALGGVAPGDVEGAAAAAASPATAALGGGGGGATGSSNGTLVCIVGPLFLEGGNAFPPNPPPVSPLTPVQDLTFLSGDRALVLHPHGKRGGEGAATTAATILPLEPTTPAFAGLRKGGGGEGGSSSEDALRFALPYTILRAFPTPFECPRGKHEEESSEEAHYCQDVLLYVSKWNPTDDTDNGDGERAVLRYSNAAFGRYAKGNPHAYAIVDAQTFAEAPAVVAAASLPPTSKGHHLRRKVSIEEEQAGVPQLTASVAIGSGPLPARQQGALPYCGNGMEAGEAYEAHVAASMRCPPLIRPILVLSPREVVLSMAWSGAEGVWGDRGEGFEGVEGASTNKGGAPPLTLPSAIASGSPLLAILTSHRLCIASPALKLLCAIPTFVPMGGPAEFGVRHVNGGPWGNSSGGVASSFGVWRSDYFSVATPAPLEDDEGGSPEALSITLDGGYNAEVKGDTGEGQSEDPFSALASLVVASPYDASSSKIFTGLTLPSASQRFPATAERSSPQDSSASFSGGIMQSTVASASAAGVKLTCPLPASRSSDTIPQDDMVEDGGGNGGSPGWTAPITGYIWLGSALLFTVGGGELMYLTARGNVGGVCTLESGAGTARQGDAIPLCIHHDRIAYICQHPVTGKSLVRLRSFSPLEPLAVSLIDHASTRPKPSFSLLGAAVPGPSGSDTPPHPVVAALSHTLSSSILVVNANSKTPSSSASLHGVKGQAAVSALAIAALARDYAAVRDAVTRYCSPTPKLDPSPLSPSSTLVDMPYLTHGESPPLSVGVSRPLVDSLVSVGFLNMAFFVMGGGSQGLRVSGESALPAEAGSGAAAEEEEEEGGSSKVGGFSNLDVYRQRANYALFPPAARAALALARGSWSQALWVLCSSSDPALGEAVLKLTGFSPLTGDEAGEENGGVVEGMKLPHPTSSLAASLRSLSKAAMGGGATRVAVLAADIAGDHALALEALIVGGFASQERLKGVRRQRQLEEVGEEEEEEEEGSRRASQMKGGPTGVKWGGYGWMPPCDIHAGLSGLVSLNKDRNYPLAAASALIRRHLLILAAAEGGNGGNDPTAPSRALDGIRGGAVFPPLAATGRSQRSSESGLLPTNYGLLPTPSQHRLAHSTPTSPFSPLFNDTLLSALASSSSSKRGGVRDPPHALLFKGVGVSGSVAFGPSTPPPPFPPLPTLLDPLPCDTLARWLGVTAPGRPYFRIRRSRAAAAEETDGQQGGDGGSGGMTMEELLGNGGGGGEGGDASASNPVEFAYACSRGKKRLKALPRGAEDAVVGYWRFHKGGEEEAAAAAGRKSWMETPGNGNGVGERVEAWLGMGGVVDLSRMASMGQLFDALALASNPPSSPTNPRLGFGHRFDAPCDPGDPKKVKDPRVLVFGCGTKHQQQQQQQQQVLPTSLPAHPHLALLLPLAVHYAAAIPLPRYTYMDVGLRPWDSANAVFTFEAWVRVGSQHPAAAIAGGDEEDEEDGGRGGGGSSSGGNSTPKAGAVINATSFTLAMRTERVRGVGASSKISARVQWSLKVTPDGALAFESGKDGEEEEENPPSLPHATLSSSPGLIPPCEWRHVAVCVDGSGGAREAMAVARGGGGGGKGGGSNSNNKAATPPSYPPATVRLYVGGVMCGEGKVPCGPPLPILEEEEGPGAGGEEEGGVPPSSPPTTLMPTHPGRATSDHLLLGPNLVGRMCETRVWACKRSGEELNDAKDFHLDLAEIKRMGGKGAMSIAIKPHHVAAPAAAASLVPLKKLGGASTVTTSSTIAPPPLSPPSTTTTTTTPAAAGPASSATATIPPPKDEGGGGGGGLRRFGLAPPTAPPATSTTSEAMRRRLGGGGSGGAPASGAAAPAASVVGEVEKVGGDFDPFAKPSPAPSSSPSEVVVVEEVEKKQYPPPSDAGADGTAAAAAVGTSAPEAPPIKLGGGGLGVGGLGGLGGLGAPPPGVTTGGKRAEMMRKKLQMQQPQ